jgi:glycogen synthase
VYRKPAAWRKLVQRAMAVDFSWEAAAAAYERLYAAARSRPRQRPERPAVR